MKQIRSDSTLIHVGTREESSYDVLVKQGALSSLPSLLGEYTTSHRYAIISDRNVASLYGHSLRDNLRKEGLDVELFVFDQGEVNKTRSTWCDLTDKMLAKSFGRDSCILALGGGVVGDVAGFVAATYMRGVPVVQIPTSLLAMIDASVGGKTGVDVSAGKNLVGAFHPPRLVIVDPTVVSTLSVDECKQGLVEAVKHGLIMDPQYFAQLNELIPELLNYDLDKIEEIVSRSIELKASVVTEDEQEHGKREILNFGHTFGHAMEVAQHYTMSHGTAVGRGMLLEIRLGIELGLTDPSTFEATVSCLAKLGISNHGSQDLNSEEIMDHLRLDKKSKLGGRRFVLISGIGSVLRNGEDWSHTIEEGILMEFLGSL